MAERNKNILILRLTGPLGDTLLNRKTPLEKAMIASKPSFDDDRGYRETSKTHPDALGEATTFANFAQTQEVYLRKAKRTRTTAYYIALVDWFSAPRLREIDVDDWTGRIGETIRVKVRDNVMVARVSVVIRDAEENVLEMGEAVQSEAGSPWWNYTTKRRVPMTPFPIVEATAQDLAGNSDSFVIS